MLEIKSRHLTWGGPMNIHNRYMNDGGRWSGPLPHELWKNGTM